MPAKKKEESTGSVRSSNSALAAFLKAHEEDHFNFVKPTCKVISTGSLLLDSYVRLRTGSIVRLAGKGAELGKTSECFVMADNFMKAMPRSKTLFIKAEARLTPELMKRSGHTFIAMEEPEKWDYGTVYVYASNTFESVAALIEEQLDITHEAGESLCIIVDSLDGLILKSDREKNLWTGDDQIKVAGVPALSKILFKRTALKIAHYDALVLITCQYAAEIKLDPYSKVPARQGDSSGGNAVNHQNDITLSYALRNSGDYIYENPNLKPDPIKNKKIGVYATIDIRKSSTDTTGTRVRIPIASGRQGSCIWVEKEVVDMALSFGLLKGKGAWFSFDDSFVAQALEDGIELKAQHQGMNGVYKYVEENKDVFNWMYNKFSELVSN